MLKMAATEARGFSAQQRELLMDCETDKVQWFLSLWSVEQLREYLLEGNKLLAFIYKCNKNDVTIQLLPKNQTKTQLFSIPYVLIHME